MVHVPDEFIMAYADGQLSDEERVWLEGMLATDAQLQSRLKPFIVTGPDQWAAFDAPLHQPVPERLLETVRSAGRPGSASEAGRTARTRAGSPGRSGGLQGLLDLVFPAGFGWQPAAGYAATLLVGVAIGAGLLTSGLIGSSPSDGALLKADRDGFVAAGRLQKALDRTPSGKGPAIEGAVRPVLSLRDRDGRLCRQYEIVAKNPRGPQGLACRESDGAWRITVLTGGVDAAGSAREASQDDKADPFAGMVGTAVKNLPGHDELSTAEELFLIEKGWEAAPAMPRDTGGN